jgi:hypothetical protein
LKTPKDKIISEIIELVNKTTINAPDIEIDPMPEFLIINYDLKDFNKTIDTYEQISEYYIQQYFQNSDDLDSERIINKFNTNDKLKEYFNNTNLDLDLDLKEMEDVFIYDSENDIINEGIILPNSTNKVALVYYNNITNEFETVEKQKEDLIVIHANGLAINRVPELLTQYELDVIKHNLHHNY